MICKVSIPKEVDIEEYFVLRAIINIGLKKTVIREKEFSKRPTLENIAAFLEETGASFVSVECNFRFQEKLPFD